MDVANVRHAVSVVEKLPSPPFLTVAICQAVVATGTMENPTWINDGLATSQVIADVVGETVTMDFGGKLYQAKQFRYVGQMFAQNNDASSAIRFLTPAGYEDWKIIPTRDAGFTNWEVVTVREVRRIILEARVLDSKNNDNYTNELEVKF